ncbi:glycosyltransferase family 4 protein [Vibrio parahaemolyticus]|uniref:glycosyltransferase family 4 protein n=1 Tax=Vibrio parahaemolyticus TaxID=670 RepID=UPI00226BA9D5|nr:glycosyltransferase family 4 protein [Vibrio parahaemolyticus]EJB8452834.1 glycosyltransferase family 4 protein [Vibrio parahaemolyticus]EJI6683778.1 glycosyltransferase family 4 protein [Vibrio parahaemolyticus]EJL6386202.1 glycosyltransferase family 4 protein [Vibrio parahaemolyticus]MCX8793694.1 glycosyltransferase family 4 protein [Vibrio parahaemolyticus]MDB6194758.1 glycosyltransferase family 4 protein [Vibrio parahaemolyticus]
MKILINTPCVDNPGGVANHFKGLRKYWSEDVTYNYISGRYKISGQLLLPLDIVKFAFRLIFFKYDVVLLNPSLGKNAIYRDALFLRLASFFKVKKVVFFHGWSEEVAAQISDNPKWFKKKFSRADCFLVLASSFKEQMEEWGIEQPIKLTTTKVDDDLLLINEENSSAPPSDKVAPCLLFLARIEENKGIYVAIEAFSLLSKKYPNIKLKIAGCGGALESAKAFVLKEGILNVEFLGQISGEKLSNAFSSSDVYILPTWHGEGMPTSVLEAMAFGLPVITRPVGGLNDFFVPNKMGSLISSRNPNDFSDAIDNILVSSSKMNEICTFNKDYAKENFMASKVALNIEKLLGEA